MSGELFCVRLLYSWGDHCAGETVLVDRQRAVTLEMDGIGSIEPPVTEVSHEAKAYDRPPRDKMVRTSKKKGKK